MGAEQSQLEQLTTVTDFRQNYITFFVNGKEYSVNTSGCDPEIGPNYLLVDYLRDKIGLTGTKYMCREGGCGACIVTIRSTHPVTQEESVKSANSCLLPLFACDGLDITTIEGMGSRKKGYHPIQQRLVSFGGTQCGFCTPGMIMTMNSLVESKPKFTVGDVEYSFDGNICRCTGFRSIIEGFKSLASNASEDLKLQAQCLDIEDMHKCPFKPQPRNRQSTSSSSGDDNLEIVQIPKNLYLADADGKQQWVKVTKLTTLYEVLRNYATAQLRYRLVAGNTGIGLYNDGPYRGYVDINDVPELNFSSLDSKGIVMGGAVTITEAIDIFDKASKMPGFVYAAEIYKHLRRVATLSVRNRGTMVGNLMIKHDHREFVSDIFLLLECIGATVIIGSSPTLTRQVTLLEFLNTRMEGKVVLAIHLPTYSPDYVFKSYKIGRRYQNATAHVNAAFLFSIEPKSYTILKRPRICFGGINADFVHANLAEQYLQGKVINRSTLQEVLKILEKEAIPMYDPLHGSPEYRLGLAQSFLYRFFLNIRGSGVAPRLQSGGEDIARAINKAKQTFDTDKTKWPLYQPVPKIESFPQASGEAQFINDIPKQNNELFGAFVLSTIANGNIESIDASGALMTPGVVAFITAKDVPGVNNFEPFYNEVEPIFIESKISYAGQAIGLLVAEDKYTAFQARSKVIVHYANVQKPVLDIREIVHSKKASSSTSLASALAGSSNLYIKNPDETNFSIPCRGITQEKALEIVKNVGANCTKTEQEIEQEEGISLKELQTVKGEFYTHPQYHFHLETQICLCVPNEDGMEVYSSTQHMNRIQVGIARCLNVPSNFITVHVRRLGGGFGAKISKANYAACATAVAAYKLNKPVRVAMDLQSNIYLIGKRLPYYVTYEAKVDSRGKIYKLDSDIWCDGGSVPNEVTSLYGMICFQSGYRANGWNIHPKVVVTDTAVNTYCRSPGSAQGVAAIEHIMDHIAHSVKQDPLEVREVNFMVKGDPLIGVPGAKLPLDNLLPAMIKELKQTADYEGRKSAVNKFNENNRWKKRGISIVPQRYPNYYAEFYFPAMITVYHSDGSVDVSHGGVEMGQGLNSKVAQVVAYTLGIPLEKVKVKPSNTFTSPNARATGASVGSEMVASAARRACLKLLERLEPIRKRLDNPTWEQLVAAAHANEILLTSQFQERDGDLTSYDVWGVTMLEVEIDVLTGDYKIVRTDVIEDAGYSLNPNIDIGQVEGGLIMGLGWWISEELIYDRDTGLILSDNTKSYNPMLPADIPEDLRVTLFQNAPNPYGVLSSKATGEPPFNMSCVVLFALRNAIDSARQDVGNYDWYQLDGAVNRELVRRLCLTTSDQFTL